MKNVSRFFPLFVLSKKFSNIWFCWLFYYSILFSFEIFVQPPLYWEYYNGPKVPSVISFCLLHNRSQNGRKRIRIKETILDQFLWYSPNKWLTLIVLMYNLLRYSMLKPLVWTWINTNLQQTEFKISHGFKIKIFQFTYVLCGYKYNIFGSVPQTYKHKHTLTVPLRY